MVGNSGASTTPIMGEMVLIAMLPDDQIMIIQFTGDRTIAELEEFVAQEYVRVYGKPCTFANDLRIQKCISVDFALTNRKRRHDYIENGEDLASPSSQHVFADLSKTMQVGNIFKNMDQVYVLSNDNQQALAKDTMTNNLTGEKTTQRRKKNAITPAEQKNPAVGVNVSEADIEKQTSKAKKKIPKENATLSVASKELVASAPSNEQLTSEPPKKRAKVTVHQSKKSEADLNEAISDATETTTEYTNVSEAKKKPSKKKVSEKTTANAKKATAETKKATAGVTESIVANVTPADAKTTVAEVRKAVAEAKKAVAATKKVDTVVNATPSEAKKSSAGVKKGAAEGKKVAAAEAKKTEVVGNETPAEAKKKKASELKKSAAEAKKAATEVKKIAVTEGKKTEVVTNETPAEAKKRAAAVKKVPAEAKKAAAEAKKVAAAEAKKEAAEAKKAAVEAKKAQTEAKKTADEAKKTALGVEKEQVESKKAVTKASKKSSIDVEGTRKVDNENKDADQPQAKRAKTTSKATKDTEHPDSLSDNQANSTSPVKRLVRRTKPESLTSPPKLSAYQAKKEMLLARIAAEKEAKLMENNAQEDIDSTVSKKTGTATLTFGDILDSARASLAEKRAKNAVVGSPQKSLTKGGESSSDSDFEDSKPSTTPSTTVAPKQGARTLATSPHAASTDSDSSDDGLDYSQRLLADLIDEPKSQVKKSTKNNPSQGATQSKSVLISSLSKNRFSLDKIPVSKLKKTSKNENPFTS